MLANLGTACGQLGDASKMRDYLERSLRTLEAHYGPDHNIIAMKLRSLGNAYGALGDASKQRDYLERALRIILAHYGPGPVLADAAIWIINSAMLAVTLAMLTRKLGYKYLDDRVLVWVSAGIVSILRRDPIWP
eukprot:4964872-Amphidinium_carterae.1